MQILLCPKCEGKRLKPEAPAITIDGKSIADVTQFSISEAKEFLIICT